MRPFTTLGIFPHCCLLIFHAYVLLANSLPLFSFPKKFQTVTGGRANCNLQGGSMEPYGMKAGELQVVKDMVKTVSLLEAEYFSCASEDYL